MTRDLHKSHALILGMMSVYNEADVIEYTLVHMKAQQIPLLVIDNGSTDRTPQILMRHVGTTIVELVTLKTQFYEWGLLLRTLLSMAEKHEPKWLLLLGADEFLESPFSSLNLKQSVELEDSRDYNLIQFNNFEFWPTEKDKGCSEPDVRKRIKHYSWNDDYQFRCFRYYRGINIDESGGHIPVFPEDAPVNLAPEKFTIRHYAIRSYEQGLRKVFRERLPRYPEHEKKKWGLDKYTKFGTDERYFVIDSTLLNEYREDGQWILKRTFDGHRGYGFPSYKSTEEIEKEMENIRKTLYLRNHHDPNYRNPGFI
jgi:glycosyltransferase involved in cell wall biosynthesis